jgi:hypothetical protein
MVLSLTCVLHSLLHSWRGSRFGLCASAPQPIVGRMMMSCQPIHIQTHFLHQTGPGSEKLGNLEPPYRRIMNDASLGCVSLILILGTWAVCLIFNSSRASKFADFSKQACASTLHAEPMEISDAILPRERGGRVPDELSGYLFALHSVALSSYS